MASEVEVEAVLVLKKSLKLRTVSSGGFDLSSVGKETLLFPGRVLSGASPWLFPSASMCGSLCSNAAFLFLILSLRFGVHLLLGVRSSYLLLGFSIFWISLHASRYLIHRNMARYFEVRWSATNVLSRM